MKIEELTEKLRRCASGKLCEGCGSGERILVCRKTIREAADQLEAQDRHIRGLLAANEAHRKLLAQMQEQLRTEEDGTGWIRTDDAQPARSGEYWARTDTGSYMKLGYSARHNAWNASDRQEAPTHAIRVTHWMRIQLAVEGDRP